MKYQSAGVSAKDYFGQAFSSVSVGGNGSQRGFISVTLFFQCIPESAAVIIFLGVHFEKKKIVEGW